MLSQLSKLTLAVAALIALVPGASLVTGIIKLPPDFNNFLSFCSAVAGPIIFFAVYKLRRQLVRLSSPVLLALMGAATVGGLVLSWETYRFTITHVIVISTLNDQNKAVDEQYVRPDNPSPPLYNLVYKKHRGNWENAILDDSEKGAEMMRIDSLPEQRWIVILLLLSQSLLIFGFLTGALTAIKANIEAASKSPT